MRVFVRYLYYKGEKIYEPMLHTTYYRSWLHLRGL